jgi:hypothetical protein
VSRESVSATAARQETGAPWDRRPGPARVGIDASEITSGIIAPERLGTGTPSAANYLRGDGTWAAADAALQGTTFTLREDFAYPIAASAQATATTIVCPATANVIWRVTAGFYVAP